MTTELKSRVAEQGLRAADPGTFRKRYGHAEPDPNTHGMRHREYWRWREDGQKFGSWVWVPGYPPPGEELV